VIRNELMSPYEGFLKAAIESQLSTWRVNR
jgi:hypothetical protein